MRTKGFTLLELIIVVVVIAILASFAVPTYSKILEKSRVREAVVVLHTIRAAEMEYYLENGEYFKHPTHGNNYGIDEINLNLNLDIEPGLWDYYVITIGVDVWPFAVKNVPPYATKNIYIKMADDPMFWYGDHPFVPSN